ncbi:MAG: hypothetical protein WBB65_09700 [Anaerolineales bacterium]
MRTALISGAYSVLSIEALSLLDAVTQAALTIAWSLLLLGLCLALGIVWRRDRRFRLPVVTFPEGWFDRSLVIGIVLVLLITAFVAWVTPPQTWDSLNYHMSKVAHWAQNNSVKPYASGVIVQNSLPPGAEFNILHLYVLSGGDRLSNFVEWFAMIGSLIAVSLAAKKLGAGKSEQILSVVFAATLPMGIVQASSTMNDYVVAFWTVCAAVETLILMQDRFNFTNILMLSGAAGLAIFTKPTAYPYLFPFALLAAYMIFKKVGWKKLLAYSSLAIILVVFINAGHFLRAADLYGTPFPEDQITRHANQMRNLKGVISNTIRNTSLHLGTPSPYINKAMAITIDQIHAWLNIDVNDPGTTAFTKFRIKKPSTNEITAGNPAHMWLLIAAFGLLFFRRQRLPGYITLYSVVSLLTFLTFAFLFKWEPFASRFHLPFFILAAPVVGLILSRTLASRFANIIGLVLLVLSLPWLLSIQSRPLVPNALSTVGSIINESREVLYFAVEPGYRAPYVDITERITEEWCTSVALSISGGGAEYPFWVLLGAPRDELQIEWLVSGTPSAAYRDADFKACAVICDETCPSEWEEVNGLPLTYRTAGFRLYMNSTVE